MKQKITRLIHSRHMLSGVFLLSLLESTVLPIALEILLLPLMQKRREQMWRIAVTATLGCIAGSVLGYFIGAWLMEILAPGILDLLGGAAQFNEIKASIKTNGFWFILIAGITPVPLQLAMLAAGATNYSLGLYLIAIAIARALRYFGLTVLVWYFGDRAEQLVLRYKKPVLWIFGGLAVAFVVYQFWG